MTVSEYWLNRSKENKSKAEREDLVETLITMSQVLGLCRHEREALIKAAEALSQEPCDDAISRQAAINIASLHFLTIDESVKALEQLPSFTQKSGKWDSSCTCSVCGKWRILESEKNDGKYKFCPNCGCRMVEPQESEEQTE